MLPLALLRMQKCPCCLAGHSFCCWPVLALLAAGGSLTDADVEHIDIYAGGYRSHSTAGGGH